MLVRFREENYRPLRTIKLALTCGEETSATSAGSVDGAEWLAKNRRDLIDAAFALNEGAAISSCRPRFLEFLLALSRSETRTVRAIAATPSAIPTPGLMLPIISGPGGRSGSGAARQRPEQSVDNPIRLRWKNIGRRRSSYESTRVRHDRVIQRDGLLRGHRHHRGRQVSHHVDVSWDEAWTGTTQVRQFKIEGNSLRIRAEGLEDGRPSSSNHDTYHRGQLATLMRQLGRKATAQQVTKAVSVRVLAPTQRIPYAAIWCGPWLGDRRFSQLRPTIRVYEAPSPTAALQPLFNGVDEGSHPTRRLPTVKNSVSEILSCAATLGIPWKQILIDEIAAEERLRRYTADVENECPLRSALKLLSSSFLRSWRIRRQIESLSLAARSASMRDAIRQLRAVFSELVGRNENEKAAFAQHLWFAYQRMLLLQRARRAAAKSRGDLPERLAFICSSARCSYDDAAWAVFEEDSPRRGHSLDAAVRKVREEGFQIPVAKTAARSVARLQRMVRASPHLRRLHRTRRSSAPPRWSPQRAQFSIDTD